MRNPEIQDVEVQTQYFQIFPNGKRHFLDEKKYYRIGALNPNVLDIRVIASSNKKLAESLITGEFGRVIEFLEISISKEQAIATINKKLMELDLDYEKVKELIKKKEEEIEERKLKNEKRTNP